MYTLDTPLLGTGVVSAEQIDQAFLSRNPQAPPLGVAIRQECARTGMNSDFIAAEIMDETANWTSPRALQANNPAGIGATDDGAWGKVFATPQDGIRAQCAHWLTYIYGASNPFANDDPRYQITLNAGHTGGITKVGQIGNGVWASAKDYATSCLSRMNALLTEFGLDNTAPAQGGNVTTIADLGLIDIRDQLPCKNYIGVRDQTLGGVIHYSAVDYPDDMDIVQTLINETNYQMGENWGTASSPAYPDGLMYHISVDPRDGKRYQCRDMDRVLWHCASWAPGGNGTGIAVHVPGGPSLVMTDVALASLTGLCDGLCAIYGFPRDMWHGHLEMSSTACPGPLMQQFVYPYRSGALHGDAPMTAPYFDPVTKHEVANGFQAYYNRNGGMVLIGRPLTEEFDGVWPDDPAGSPKRTMQIFEREVVGFFPENQGDARVQGLRLGAMYAKSLGLHGVGIDA
jgi:hypothetical protein